jgi:hypothetical protein
MAGETVERGWSLSWTRLRFLAITGQKTSCTPSPEGAMAEVRQMA